MPITLQTAEKEYEKNPDIKKEEIQKLQEWMDKQPHLPKLKEVDLIVFYHSCENSMELTKTTIDLNYTLRTHLDLYFKDRDPTESKTAYALEKTVFAPLSMKTPEGYQVVYCRLLDKDPSHFFMDATVKAFVMMQDLLQMENGTYEGVVIILDCDSLVFGHLTRLPLVTIKTVLFYLQEAMPVRLKGFHFLNTPSFFDKILAMMKPFLKKELMDLLHLHPTPETIYKFVPKAAFPKDIGGEFDSYDKILSDTVTKLTENRQILLDEEKVRVVEAKRPGKPKNIGEIFGVEGSFKKLDID